MAATNSLVVPPGATGVISSAGVIGPAGARGGIGYGGGGRPAAQLEGQRPQSSIEQLGTKMIDGVLVTGTRTTTIIPEGMQGNDRPMTTTSETRVSKELQLPILSVNYSPLNGTMTRKFANFSTAEPDASLFQPPPGYSVVDEKEGFTIRWGEQ